MNTSHLINEYAQLLSETNNQKQKELLKNEMMVVSNYAISRDVVERQFYIMFWDRYQENSEKDILKGRRKFESENIRCEILKKHEIVRLCNLINDSTYVQVEDTEVEVRVNIIHIL
ncbi:hypothetical protein [Tepidibacter aestuarii]|uniref:hypothetical protein n=1 Tax=Tepidibacter aestuarii TaxID=2925782 RepID=UPI0020BE68F7|nr:hypothetical protein [Tepidibacter aestuarii]CAH2213867.1 protein of unknown function [Tepidibacter aestuarii]